MIVWHGTTLEIREPGLLHSRTYLDFGPGFYLTPSVEQAERWALRKAMRRHASVDGRPCRAIINVYELSEDFRKRNVLTFDGADAQWLEFVCACRRGENVSQGYDMIVGTAADDAVFKAVNMYFTGVWDKERTIRELRSFRAKDQYCLTTQAVIGENLRFLESCEVKDEKMSMRCPDEVLEQFYRQSLEVRLIGEIALEKNLDLRIAADIYYRSELAVQISQGAYGIQYLDYHVLARDLIENESALFVDPPQVRADAR